MRTDNFLDLLPPALIPFILKNLSIQDLYNCNSINDTWKKELYYELEGYYQTAERMRDACKKIDISLLLQRWLNKQFATKIG